MQQIIVEYPILGRTPESRCEIIKAGKRWTDEKKQLQYEGIELHIPKEVADQRITFAVLSVEQGETDTYHLWLHAHSNIIDLAEPYDTRSLCMIDAGGDVETRLTLSLEMMKKLTQLSRRDIDEAFGSVKLGTTYNLLASLPRTITLEKDKIVITKSITPTIDAANVCQQLLNNDHPIDS